MAQRQKYWVFVGGYGTAIETFAFDPARGALTPAGLTEGVAEAPTFLALDEARGVLFAVSELGGADAAQPGRALSFQVDAGTGELTPLSDVWAGGSNAVHCALTHSGNYLLTASSSTVEGRVAVIPVAPDGTLAEPTDSQIAGKNAHGLVQSPDGQFVWVVCRGDEHVAQYRLDETTGKLSALSVPSVGMAGPAGPRHVAVHPTLRVVYALLDWSGEIACYRYDEQGLLTAMGSVSAFPPGKQPRPVTGTMTAAELEVSRDGRRVYASTRTPDCQSLAVLDVGASGELTLRANEGGAGLIRGPRHFISSRDGRHLLVANQDDDSLLAFRLDEVTGAPALCGNVTTPTRVRKPNALAWGRF